jgi:hypothetical protein
VFAFNTIGYYGLYIGIKNRLDAEATQQFDQNEYSGGETMIVKMPYTLPYPINLNGYERVDGEFESNGELYKLVKHTIVNDTLYVLMVKSSALTNLNKSFSDFAGNSTDTPASKTLKLIQQAAKDFVSYLSHVENDAFGWSSELSRAHFEPQLILFSQQIISPPPEV